MSLTDPAFVAELDTQLSDDLDHSEKIILFKWVKRPFIVRIAEAASGLLRRQL
ncbi:hypothetical protein D3C86_2046760 [compost metagenome]